MKSKEDYLEEAVQDLFENDYSSEFVDGYQSGFYAGIEYANQSKWIDVSRGIPDDEFWYRVLIDGKHHILPFCAHKGKWYCYGESKSTDRSVTHYQSFEDLPTP